MIEVGKLVEDDIIAQNFGHLHQTDIERNGAIRRTTAPTSGGVTEATFVVIITIELGIIF